jgi:type IV pilus assembly protein PilQ
MYKFKHKTGFLSSAVAFAALLWGVQALSQESASRSLQSIDYVTLEGERLLLTLTLSGTAPEPAVFTIDQPARLSLDLPATSLAMTERFKKVNIGKVRAVAAAEAKGRTRVVVELTDLAPYTVRVEGNKILVQLDGGPVSSRAAVPTVEGRAAPAITGTQTGSISAIDFRRGEKGEGRVVVTLADPKIPVDVSERGGKIIARFKNVRLPDELLRRLDVLDFATPVKFVDASRDGINAEIQLTPVTGVDFEQVAYQAGNQFSLELHPLGQDEIEKRKRENPQFVGDRITLSFQNVDIRSLLQIIADVAGVNMVVSDSVAGDLAMRLQNVPWDQALDIILKTKGLGMRQQGNVMLVAPIAELAEREKVEMESDRQRVELAPLRSEIIQVNYAKASDLAKLLKTATNSLLTARGSISVDDRTNTLIVLETREKLSEIRDLVSQLDLPVRQVLIESRIVIARDDYRKELGTRFGVSYVDDNSGDGLFRTAGGINATDAAVNDFLEDGFPVTIGPLGDRLNVNLPPTNGAAGSIAFAILGGNYLIDLELSALQSEGRGEVVSTPRVITANGKEAVIEQGREIPYLESSSSGAATIAFRKAVLSLTVTPQITPDARVLLDLRVTADTQGEDVALGIGAAPSIDTRRLNTQVLVESGNTVVLGGVFQQETTKDKTKVPLLGDIPLFGQLFRNTSDNDSKRELLIFVTPKILQEGLRVN